MKGYIVFPGKLHIILGVGLVISLFSLSGCFHSDNDSNFNFKPIPPVSNTDFEESESFSIEVPVVNHVQLTLQSKSSSVSISGMAGASVISINGTKRVQSESSEDALEQLQLLDVDVQDLINEIQVKTIQPQDTGGRNYIVDFVITLPPYLAINIANLAGDISISGIENNVSVDTLSGAINITNMVGSNFVTVLAGSIDNSVSLPLNGIIDLYVLNGNINLSVPVNTSAQINSKVSNGTINTSNLTIQNEVQTPTSLSGQLGNGQGQITLEVGVVGNISVAGF